MSAVPSRAPHRLARIERFYEQTVGVRLAVLWVVMLALTFGSFGVHLWLGDGYGEAAAATTAPEVPSLLGLLALIWSINLANAAVIGLASTLFRFGPFNVGTLYLAVQLVMIGRIAGLNTFAYPMASVSDGLLQFIRVGLWEVTAYVIVAAVTITKARWIADRLGASEWRQRRTWRELDWSGTERSLLVAAVGLILGAGLVEGISIVHA